MINFLDKSREKPFQRFHKEYEKALNNGQKNIEAINIASYNKIKNEVDSRFVNIKFVKNEKLIFFTNYNSPKSISFNTHNQISACIFWSSTNLQIRFRAKIKKTSIKFNNEYFKKRQIDKNALAISSYQSRTIKSYDQVIEKYKKTKETKNLFICPEYWGGFEFIPYEIEFWEGNASRLNKRDFYKLNDNIWHHFILEP